MCSHKSLRIAFMLATLKHAAFLVLPACKSPGVCFHAWVRADQLKAYWSVTEAAGEMAAEAGELLLSHKIRNRLRINRTHNYISEEALNPCIPLMTNLLKKWGVGVMRSAGYGAVLLLRYSRSEWKWFSAKQHLIDADSLWDPCAFPWESTVKSDILYFFPRQCSRYCYSPS